MLCMPALTDCSVFSVGTLNTRFCLSTVKTLGETEALGSLSQRRAGEFVGGAGGEQQGSHMGEDEKRMARWIEDRCGEVVTDENALEAGRSEGVLEVGLDQFQG